MSAFRSLYVINIASDNEFIPNCTPLVQYLHLYSVRYIINIASAMNTTSLLQPCSDEYSSAGGMATRAEEVATKVIKSITKPVIAYVAC
jgi:hypothetical protein